MVNHSGAAQLIEFWSHVKDHVWRGLYLLGVLSFLLPFVTVKGCGSSEITDYRGFQLITDDFAGGGWCFLLPICIGLTFFGLSFVGRRGGRILQGFFKGWRAVFSSLAAVTVLLFTFLIFIFSTVHVRIGWILCAVSWSLVYLRDMLSGFAHLRELNRSRALPACGTSWQIVLLSIMHYLLVLEAFACPVIWTANWDAEALPWLAGGLLFFSVPIFLVLQFAAEGISTGERWAIVWSALLSSLILTGGIAGIVYAAKDSAPYRVLLAVPAAILGTATLAGSLSALRRMRLAAHS